MKCYLVYISAISKKGVIIFFHFGAFWAYCETVEFVGSGAPSFTVILQNREKKDPIQADLCFSAQGSTPPNTSAKEINHGGRNCQTSTNFREMPSTAAITTPKVHKVVIKGNMFPYHSIWGWEIYVLVEKAMSF